MEGNNNSICLWYIKSCRLKESRGVKALGRVSSQSSKAKGDSEIILTSFPFYLNVDSYAFAFAFGL